jgi:hypothetical protein
MKHDSSRPTSLHVSHVQRNDNEICIGLRRDRSTATGFRAIVSTAAGILGLTAVSLMYTVFESNWTSISVLCAISLIAPVMVWLFLPETAGRRLEGISPE